MKQLVLISVCVLACSVISARRSMPQTETAAAATTVHHPKCIEFPVNIPDGTWQFQDLAWTFGKSVGPLEENSTRLAQTESLAKNTTAATRPNTLDADMLSLIHRWMKNHTSNGMTRSYSVESPTIRGAAVTRLVSGNEIPQRIHLSMPAYDGLWTTFTATRIVNANQTPILTLPKGFEISATRMTTLQQPWCHFVTTNDVCDPTPRFLACGWNVHASDNPAHFSIEKNGERFHVSIVQPTANSSVNLLVRKTEQ